MLYNWARVNNKIKIIICICIITILTDCKLIIFKRSIFSRRLVTRGFCFWRLLQQHLVNKIVETMRWLIYNNHLPKHTCLYTIYCYIIQDNYNNIVSRSNCKYASYRIIRGHHRNPITKYYRHRIIRFCITIHRSFVLSLDSQKYNRYTSPRLSNNIVIHYIGAYRIDDILHCR